MDTEENAPTFEILMDAKKSGVCRIEKRSFLRFFLWLKFHATSDTCTDLRMQGLSVESAGPQRTFLSGDVRVIDQCCLVTGTPPGQIKDGELPRYG